MCTRFSISSNTITWLCYTFFFISLVSDYLTIVGVKGYLWTLSHAITHTPHSVGLQRRSYQFYAYTSSWQHTTPTRDIHVPGGIRTRNPSKQAAADLCLRPRSHRDQHDVTHTPTNIKYLFCLLTLNWSPMHTYLSTCTLRRPLWFVYWAQQIVFLSFLFYPEDRYTAYITNTTI